MSNANKSRYQVYRDAAEIVRSGWLKRDYVDASGNQCLVQSVLTSSGIRSTRELPRDMVAEIDTHLMRFLSYRMVRKDHLSRGGSVQGAIMAWNDMPWRRQSAVVDVLEAIASTMAEREIARLSMEAVQLKYKIDQLNARVEQLETENRSLRKRLANHLTLKQSRQELQVLSDELERTWSDLVVARG